eukprot:10154982-Lingulodinium_polyedra.AAC.1
MPAGARRAGARGRRRGSFWFSVFPPRRRRGQAFLAVRTKGPAPFLPYVDCDVGGSRRRSCDRGCQR